MAISQAGEHVNSIEFGVLIMKPLELKWQMQKAGISQADLARHLSLDPASVNRIIKGTRKISADEMEKIRAFLNNDEMKRAYIANEQQNYNPTIPEIDIRAGAGAGGLVSEDWQHDGNGNTMAVDAIKAEWGIPGAWVNHTLRAQAGDLRIVEILGDSNQPTLASGDRVFIDTGHRVPSPPGLYALWDGLGVVVKRVEIIPNSEPVRLNLISDNPHHAPYEVLAEEANIIGRVCGRISLL